MLLEVIATSVEDAVAAEEGGAQRLEIISHYEVGGFTPPINLVKEILAAVNIPIRVMVRETESFFVEDEKIIESLSESARSISELYVDGLVLGFLKEDGGQTGIDHRLLTRVLSCAPNIKVTFHRAFELLPDTRRAIAELKGYSQIDRILTSGGAGPWIRKSGYFAELAAAAGSEIEIIAGGGLDAGAINALKGTAGLNEFHVGVAARDGDRIDGSVRADRVKALMALFQNLI